MLPLFLSKEANFPHTNVSCKIGQREELPNILFISTNYMDQSTVRIQRTKLLTIIGHGEGHQPRQTMQKRGREELPLA